jgi:ethanolamine transporter EutH
MRRDTDYYTITLVTLAICGAFAIGTSLGFAGGWMAYHALAAKEMSQ